MAAIFVLKLISLHHIPIQLRIPGVLACIQGTIPNELSWFSKPTAGIQIKAGELSCAYHHIPIERVGSRWWVDCVWNVMAHAQKPDFVFRRNGRVHLNRRGSQFSRLRAAEVCASAVGMLDTPCSKVVWRVLATHYIRQFPPSLPLP
jgi:hypothetical protein